MIQLASSIHCIISGTVVGLRSCFNLLAYGNDGHQFRVLFAGCFWGVFFVLSYFALCYLFAFNFPSWRGGRGLHIGLKETKPFVLCRAPWDVVIPQLRLPLCKLANNG